MSCLRSGRIFVRFRNVVSLLVAAVAFGAPLLFVSRAFAQGPIIEQPDYPGVAPAPPLFDQPLVASTGWNNSGGRYGMGGTFQITLKPVRDCRSFRLVFANSAISENRAVRPPISVRASLFVSRPKQPTIVRQVTFHQGEAETALGPETMILSDTIPEYWTGAENATLTIRTYVRLSFANASLPIRADWFTLTGNNVKQVTAASEAPDLTMDAPDEAQLARAVEKASGFGPVAILGDADPSLPSVAIIGSSSVSEADSYVALALRRDKIPFVILGAAGTTARDYQKAVLRPQIDASCSHVFTQYGRNDIGYTYNGAAAARNTLNTVEASLLYLWERLKLQGAWVSQTTIPTRTTGDNYTDPDAQTPTPAEVPLRLPLNDWIRKQTAVDDTPLDAFYEIADEVEYFDRGQRTSKWRYGVGKGGKRFSLTSDGLHPNEDGRKDLAEKVHGSDFSASIPDFVAPTPAEAIVSADGTRLTLRFNEAKSAPVIFPEDLTGFSLTVNNAPRLFTGGYPSGPKELTFYIGGKAIQKDDLVSVGFLPGVRQAITDSSALRNAVAPFAGFIAYNKATGADAGSNAPQISVSRVVTTRETNALKLVITLTNNGGVTAYGTRLTKITLGDKTVKGSLPLILGTVSPGASVSVTLTWPLLPGGTKTALKLTGDCGQSGFSSSIKVTVP